MFCEKKYFLHIAMVSCLFLHVNMLLPSLKKEDKETAYRRANSVIYKVPNLPLAIYNRDMYEGGSDLAHMCADGFLINNFMGKRFAYVGEKLVEASDQAQEFVRLLQKIKSAQFLLEQQIDRQEVQQELRDNLLTAKNEFCLFVKTEHRYHKDSYNPFKKELIIAHLMRHFFGSKVDSFVASHLPINVVRNSRITQLSYEQVGSDTDHSKAQAELQEFIDIVGAPNSLCADEVAEAKAEYEKIKVEVTKAETECKDALGKVQKVVKKSLADVQKIFAQQTASLGQNQEGPFKELLKVFGALFNFDINFQKYLSPVYWIGSYDVHGGFRHSVPTKPYLLPLPSFLSTAWKVDADKKLPVFLPYALSPVTMARAFLKPLNPLYKYLSGVMVKSVEGFVDKQSAHICKTIFPSPYSAKIAQQLVGLSFKMALLAVDARSHDYALNERWTAYCIDHAEELLVLIDEYKKACDDYGVASEQGELAEQALALFIQQAHCQNQSTISQILKTRSVWNKGRIYYLMLPVICLAALPYRSCITKFFN